MTRFLTKLTIIFLGAILTFGISTPPAFGQAKKTKAATTASKSKKGASSSQKKSTANKSANSSKGTTARKTTRKRSSRSRKTTQSSREAAYQAPEVDIYSENEKTVDLSPRTPVVDSKRKISVEKPDLEKIRQETSDPDSPFYFPKLMKKYSRNDTTMTKEEYRNFYLGYMFQEDYDPYRTSPYSGVTDELRAKASHTKEEIDTIRKYAELSLRDNPFDLRQMSFLVHVLKEKRKDMSAKIWEYRLENLLGAIKSTGTGEDVDNAWYVIYPMHEYDMVQLLGYEATDAEFIEPGCDYLTVSPEPETEKRLRDKVAKGFYFNVEMLQKEYERKHPESADDIPAT